MNLLTVNLEKKLIKENRKINTPLELLVIKEYERIGHLEENDALQRVGLHRVAKAGRLLKQERADKLKQTKEFNKERVFHVSQIEAICNKYYLRFLPAHKYNSTIDSDLPNRISTFEVSYGTTCTTGNTYIAAPEESFELEEKDKDPLFFYKINEDYFYLIHKWGNDLSIFRRVKSLLSNTYFCVPLTSFIFTLPLLLFNFMDDCGRHKQHGTILYYTFSVLALTVCLISNGLLSGYSERIRYVKINEWRSIFKNKL